MPAAFQCFSFHVSGSTFKVSTADAVSMATPFHVSMPAAFQCFSFHVSGSTFKVSVASPFQVSRFCGFAVSKFQVSMADAVSGFTFHVSGFYGWRVVASRDRTRFRGSKFNVQGRFCGFAVSEAQ